MPLTIVQAGMGGTGLSTGTPLSSTTAPATNPATGTPSASTYLRGDGTWASIASSQWTTSGSDIYYNTGNVGIGTTSVESFGGGHKTLEVAGSTNTEGGVFKTATSGSAGSGSTGTEMLMFTDSVGGKINVVSSHPAVFYTANTERMRIDSSGNVGIGTTSPSAFGAGYTSLCVNASTAPIVDLFVGGTRTASFNGTSTYSQVSTVTNTPLLFGTNGTERARLDTSGNMFVGGASQSAATGVVYSKSNAKAWVFFTQSGGSITVQNSFNVSSVTRAGGGIYDVNFSTAMSSNAYACVGSCNSGGSSTLGTAPTYGDRQASATPTSTSSCRLISGQTASATCYDAFWNSVIVFGT